ncbi:MAG: DUF2142 domain-containing protein [Lachnospiraceae bacterium]|nr:DUF2142 domain-containing protein [Lachnospiraceae bacterium]
MHQMKKRNSIFLHLICILCACLISCAAVFSTDSSIPDTISSDCYEDLSLAEDGTSILDQVSLRAKHCTLDGLHVCFEKPEDEKEDPDPQLLMTFEEGTSVNVRTVELTLEEGFLYDVTCVLFYPNEEGSYEDECSVEVTLPREETSVIFEIPEELGYSVAKLRIDIDEDYTIADIRISNETPVQEYSLEKASMLQRWLITLAAVFALAEGILYCAPWVMQFAGYYLKNKKEINALLLTLAGAILAGNLAAYLLFHLTGRDYSQIWIAMISLCSAIVAYQLRLLFAKDNASVPEKGRGRILGSRILFWAGILVFCLFIAFEWIDGSEEMPEIAGLIRFQFPFVFAVAETILAALLYQKYVLNVREDSISFLNIYIALFFLMGLAYLLVFLPYVSPDEPSHFASAYRVSNLLLGKTGLTSGDRLLMRAEDFVLYGLDEEALSSEYYMQVTEEFRFFASDQSYVIADGAMVTNAIFSYIVPGIGIALARMLHMSGTMTFLMGRLANLIFFTAVLRFLMKKIPFGRTALFAIAMMPMTLHMAASYSYDVMTFGFVTLFVVQVMCMVRSAETPSSMASPLSLRSERNACHWQETPAAERGSDAEIASRFRTVEKVSQRDYRLCVIYGILMAPSKMVYIPLLLLIFLVPWERLGETKKEAWKKKLSVVGIPLAATCVIMVIISLVSADSTLRKMAEQSVSVNMLSWIDEEGYTISWVITHMGAYILMLARTVVRMMDYYFFTMIGSKLGWLDVDVPQVYAVASFVMLLLAVNIRDERSEAARIGFGKKLWIAFLCAGCVFATILVMTVSWTPMSYDYVAGVQGRYFIPLLIPAIWLLPSRLVEVKSVVRKYLVFGTGLLNLWILVYVFAQYIVGT